MQVKICGITEAKGRDAAIHVGASALGFVFYPPSPRFLTLDQASELVRDIPKTVKKFALTVDATDADLAAIIKAMQPDALQLSGDESPERVKEIRDHFNLPVYKAIGLATAEDLVQINNYLPVVDGFFLDTKITGEKGGTGQVFDWNILKDFKCQKPWFLAGGLTPDNVAEAIKATGAKAVDVSSGVESVRGIKDVEKVKAFVRVALSS